MDAYAASSYRPMSIRGVPILGSSVEQTGGRRTAQHDVVDGSGWVEDVGRTRHTWTITAILVGKDALDRSAKLDAALDAYGPAVWVRAVGDPVSVSIRSWRARIDRDRGRVQYTIEVEESGEPVESLIAQVAAQTTRDRVASVIESAAARFESAWSAAGRPAAIVTASISRAREVSGAVNAAIRRVADPGVVGDVLGQLEALDASIDGIARTPASIAAAWASMVEPMAATGSSSCLAVVSSVTSSTMPASPSTLDDNRRAIEQLVRTVAAGAACVALTDEVSTGTWSVYDDTIARLALLQSTVDGVLSDIDDPTLWRLLRTAADDTGRAVRLLAITMPRLRVWTPGRESSVLEIAQRWYQDADRADEIVARNGIDDPGWVLYPLRLVVTA